MGTRLDESAGPIKTGVESLQSAFINARPGIVELKARRGGWEGDAIEGASKKGYVATFVDRKTKYLVTYRLEHKTPESLKKTATVDNGREFAAHKDLARTLSVKVYFAHPYHAWERGLNEHTKGLIRQHLPKNRPLVNLADREPARIVERLNNRPRVALGKALGPEAGSSQLELMHQMAVLIDPTPVYPMGNRYMCGFQWLSVSLSNRHPSSQPSRPSWLSSSLDRHTHR